MDELTPATPLPAPPAAAPLAPVQGHQPKAEPFRRYAVPIDGTTFYLSDRERMVCETFVRTNGNVSECARQVNRKFGRHYGSNTIRRWIDRKRLITRYLEELGDKKLELENFTNEDWKLMGIQVLKGKRQMNAIQRQLWSDYGKLEVHKDAGSGGGDRNTNIQINFGERE